MQSSAYHQQVVNGADGTLYFNHQIVFIIKKKSNIWNIACWFFSVLFLIIGIMNMIYVHVVFGIFYIILSMLFIPATSRYLKEKFGFSISNKLKLLLGFLILWATLAVGDLMELIESWIS